MAWRDGYTAASLMCVAAQAAIGASLASDGISDDCTVSVPCQPSQTSQTDRVSAIIRPDSKATKVFQPVLSDKPIPFDTSDPSDKPHRPNTSDRSGLATALRQLDMAALMGGPRFRPLVDAAIARLQDDAIAAALVALRQRQKAAADAAAAAVPVLAVPMTATAQTDTTAQPGLIAPCQQQSVAADAAAIPTAAAIQTVSLLQPVLETRTAATVSGTGTLIAMRHRQRVVANAAEAAAIPVAIPAAAVQTAAAVQAATPAQPSLETKPAAIASRTGMRSPTVEVKVEVDAHCMFVKSQLYQRMFRGVDEYIRSGSLKGHATQYKIPIVEQLSLFAYRQHSLIENIRSVRFVSNVMEIWEGRRYPGCCTCNLPWTIESVKKHMKTLLTSPPRVFPWVKVCLVVLEYNVYDTNRTYTFGPRFLLVDNGLCCSSRRFEFESELPQGLSFCFRTLHIEACNEVDNVASFSSKMEVRWLTRF